MMKNKLYLVKYYGGDYDDFYEKEVFVTSVKSKATKYCTKFNKTLKKWKDYYSQYEEEKCVGLKWYKDGAPNYRRWVSLRRHTKCYWIEIETR